jgi:hypothetical protein
LIGPWLSNRAKNTWQLMASAEWRNSLIARGRDIVIIVVVIIHEEEEDQEEERRKKRILSQREKIEKSKIAREQQ